MKALVSKVFAPLACCTLWSSMVTAKECISHGYLQLVSGGIVTTLCPPNVFPSNATDDYGTIKLHPGDQLLFGTKVFTSGWNCNSVSQRNGQALTTTGSGQFDVSQPGDYVGYSAHGLGFHHTVFTVEIAEPNGEDEQLGLRLFLKLRGASIAAKNFEMRDDLAQAGLLPCTEPYTDLGFAPGSNGQETVDGCEVSFATINAVDWVHVELLLPSGSGQVVAAANGILTKLGRVVATDGAGPLLFPAPCGEYRIRVMHRNHADMILPSMPLRGYPPIAVGSDTPLDLAMLGMAIQVSFAPGCSSEACVLRSGNARQDAPQQGISYIGANNDRDPILVRVSGSTPTNMVSGYFPEDVNMDGVVKYIGTNNDRDAILQALNGDPLGVVYGPEP